MQNQVASTQMQFGAKMIEERKRFVPRLDLLAPELFLQCWPENGLYIVGLQVCRSVRKVLQQYFKGKVAISVCGSKGAVTSSDALASWEFFDNVELHISLYSFQRPTCSGSKYRNAVSGIEAMLMYGAINSDTNVKSIAISDNVWAKVNVSHLGIILTRHGGTIEDLKLGVLLHDVPRSITDKKLVAGICSCKSLRKFTLDTCTGNRWKGVSDLVTSVLFACPLLQKLDLSGSKMNESDFEDIASQLEDNFEIHKRNLGFLYLKNSGITEGSLRGGIRDILPYVTCVDLGIVNAAECSAMQDAFLHVLEYGCGCLRAIRFESASRRGVFCIVREE